MSEPSEAVGTPFLPFHRPWFGEEELEQVREALQSGWLTRGPKTLAFEEAFRRYIGASAAVGVNSATSGLHLALVTLGIGAGDEVITTPITFAATPNEIEHAGARPIFVDVDPRTWLIDPQRIAEAVTPRTKAIMPVHLYGQSCDMDMLRDIARTHDLCIVEDAAHAIESTWKDEKIGTIGDITVFSFYPTKNISTGEGGMLTTMDSDLAERASRLAMHGNSKDAWKRYSDSGFSHYMLEERGYKYHMFDLLAAIGLAQLPKIQAWWERRSVLWRRYDEAFRDMPGIRPIPHIMPGRHAYHLYVIEIDPITAGIERDALMQALQADGIGVGIHYVGMHLQPYYRTRYGFRPEDFPVATRASQRMLSLPLYPRLTDAEQERIVTTVARLLPSLH